MKHTKYFLLTILLIIGCNKNNITEPKSQESVNKVTEGVILKEDASTGVSSLITDNIKGVDLTTKQIDSIHTVIISPEGKTDKVTMLYKDNSLFPYQMIVENGNYKYSMNFENYNKDTGTFDMVVIEDGVENFRANGVKLSKTLDESKFAHLNSKAKYDTETILMSSMVLESIDQYTQEHPMPRNWFSDLWYAIAKICNAIGDLFKVLFGK